MCREVLHSRRVQYVHCMMHKCTLAELGGNKKHKVFLKKHVNFTISGGNVKSRGNHFLEIGEKCSETARIEGKFKNVSQWLKKVVRNFYRVKLGKFSTEPANFSKIGGKSETEEDASLPQGRWTPLLRRPFTLWREIGFTCFTLGSIVS